MTSISKVWSVLDCVEAPLVVMSRLLSINSDYAPLYIHSFRLCVPKRHIDAQRILKKHGRQEICTADISDKLKWHRHRLGLMQDEVADYCGLSRGVYQTLEAGKVDLFPHEAMLKIARLFEIGVEELLDEYNRFMFRGQGNATRSIRKETGLNIKQFEKENSIPRGRVGKWEKERVLLSKYSWNKYYRRYLK